MEKVPMRSSRYSLFALAGLLLAPLWLAAAGSAPASEVILSVSASRPAAIHAELDLKALQQMPRRQIATSTPWTEGVSAFEGVLMRDFLKELGIAGSTVKLTALNDYSIVIPVADFERYDVLLAYTRDGKAMPVRDKGPLWIVYPLDSHPELNGQETHAKMIWQVRRMDVE
jgi:hypothetical protein